MGQFNFLPALMVMAVGFLSTENWNGFGFSFCESSERQRISKCDSSVLGTRAMEVHVWTLDHLVSLIYRWPAQVECHSGSPGQTWIQGQPTVPALIGFAVFTLVGTSGPRLGPMWLENHIKTM
ncbi:hypothetical protein MRB53_018807 [Persea americana]|uniref:Uncharacterized protein n=1 Tax=Persea americana TaxID=3435 RepID=A0ACC2M952_PERAE|nr:hypothetical protein MRB53_018807 [Persea americana]